MSTISAGTSATTALVATGDTTGQLVLQTNGTTTAVTITTAGAIGIGSSPSYGTSGQVLTSAGSGAAPTWSTPSSGVVKQVVQATRSTGTNTTSTSYVTSNLSVSITPSSSSNKILIIFHAHCSKDGDSGIWLSLRRGATQISEFIGNAYFDVNGNVGGTSCSITYLDSPATTSSTTYEIFFRSQSGTSTAKMFINSAMGTITAMEIAA